MWTHYEVLLSNSLRQRVNYINWWWKLYESCVETTRREALGCSKLLSTPKSLEAGVIFLNALAPLDFQVRTKHVNAQRPVINDSVFRVIVQVVGQARDMQLKLHSSNWVAVIWIVQLIPRGKVLVRGFFRNWSDQLPSLPLPCTMNNVGFGLCGPETSALQHKIAALLLTKCRLIYSVEWLRVFERSSSQTHYITKARTEQRFRSFLRSVTPYGQYVQHPDSMVSAMSITFPLWYKQMVLKLDDGGVVEQEKGQEPV